MSGPLDEDAPPLARTAAEAIDVPGASASMASSASLTTSAMTAPMGTAPSTMC